MSEEAKQKLAEITAQIDSQSTTGPRFVKFKDGENKLLSFVPEMSRPAVVTYPSSPNKQVQRYKFYARDLTTDASSQEVLEWTSSQEVAKQLVRWISKGYFDLSITRHGSDLKTTYDIEPLLD